MNAQQAQQNDVSALREILALAHKLDGSYPEDLRRCKNALIARIEQEIANKTVKA